MPDITAAEFDGLDATAGLPSGYQRLRQKEADHRWRASYVHWSDGQRFRAVIPLYACRARTWSDPAYDPGGWGLPAPMRQDTKPWTSLLVGGCADRRSGLHVDPGARTPGQLRPLLARIARLAAAEGRLLVFPYMYRWARMALAAATDDRIVWCRLAREACFHGVADPDWEARQNSKVRYVLRRDRRLIARAGLVAEETTWPAVNGWAAAVIAEHNIRKGQRDHPEFVGLRYAEWDRNDAARLIVFTVEFGTTRAALTALAGDRQLELYEIGLPGPEGGDRLAAYVALLFHLPIRFARAHGLSTVRAGVAAETPKAARGAVFDDLYGGVLSMAETRRLADAAA